MNLNEAIAAWRQDSAKFAEYGIHLPDVQSYIPDGWGANFELATDAQPSLATTPNTGVPMVLTTLIDPAVFRVLFAPNKAAIIFGEQRKGDWLMDTAMFPTVEHTGEVSSYGDYATSGRTGVNTMWPQRQQYLFQTVKEYGERELERAGLGRINWVSEIDVAAATVLNKFLNLTYFFGVSNLQNYGLLNDPALPASITPGPKGGGGVAWITAGAVTATANEVYNDIQSLYAQLVAQTSGLVEQTDRMVLAMSPGSSVALTATNSYGVNVNDLLKKNFPNIRIETAVQYGVITASNPQGQITNNMVQLIAENVEGQQTGYCSFGEKMRAHPIIRYESYFRQKQSSGTWGAIIRQPFAIATMLGV